MSTRNNETSAFPIVVRYDVLNCNERRSPLPPFPKEGAKRQAQTALASILPWAAVATFDSFDCGVRPLRSEAARPRHVVPVAPALLLLEFSTVLGLRTFKNSAALLSKP